MRRGRRWFYAGNSQPPPVRQSKQTALCLSLIVNADGYYQIYLDNMGISKENVPSEQFGKYDYYNGTSMEMPHVTGATASVACAYPKEDALDRMACILGCVRKSDSLQEKVLSGGTLDLLKADAPNTYIQNISLNENRNIRIEGRYLTEAVETVDNKAVMPKSQSETEILLDLMMDCF